MNQADSSSVQLQVKAYAKELDPAEHEGCIPVMVSIKAPPLSGMAAERPPVDLVLVLNVQKGRPAPVKWRMLLMEAVEVALGKLGNDDRIAVLADSRTRSAKYSKEVKLMQVSDKNCRQVQVSAVNKAIRSDTLVVTAFKLANSMLHNQECKDTENRAAYVIVISNSDEQDIGPLLAWRFLSVDAFGFRDAHNARTMCAIASSRECIYALLDDERGGITQVFAACIHRITSAAAAMPIEVKLKCERKLVIDAIDAPRISYCISYEKNDGTIWTSANQAGVPTKFIVYLKPRGKKEHNMDLLQFFTVRVKYGHVTVNAPEGEVMQPSHMLHGKVVPESDSKFHGKVMAESGNLHSKMMMQSNKPDGKLVMESHMLDRKVVAESDNLDGKVEPESDKLEGKVAMESNGKAMAKSDKLDGKVEPEFDKLEGKVVMESDEPDGKAMAESDKLDGKVEPESDKLKGKVVMKSDEPSGKAMAESDKLDGKVVMESDEPGGKAMAESDKLDGKVVMESDKLDRKVVAESDKLDGKVEPESDKLKGKVVMKSDEPGGKAMAESDKLDGKVEPESDKLKGKVVMKSDEPGGKAMAESDKLDGKVVMESDEPGGKAMAESDKLDGKVVMESDKLDRKVVAKSDKLDGKVEPESDRLEGKVAMESDGKAMAKSEKLDGKVEPDFGKLEGKVAMEFDGKAMAKSDKLDGKVGPEFDKLEGKVVMKSDEPDGKAMAESDKLDGKVEPESDKLKGKLVMESDEPGGKAMAESDKLDGKVVMESDEPGGKAMAKSDKLDGKVVMESDKLDRKVVAESDKLDGKVEQESDKLEGKVAMESDGKEMGESDKLDGKVELEFDNLEGKDVMESDEPGGKAMAESDKLDGKVVMEYDKLKGKVVMKSDEPGGKAMAESDKLDGKVVMESDEPGGKVMAESDKLDGKEVMESDKLDRKVVAESDKLDGKVEPESDKLEGKVAMESDGKAMGVSDKLDGKVEPESDKLKGKEVMESDEPGGKAMAESDKLDGKVVMESDKLDRKAVAESDKLDGKVEPESDKLEGKVAMESDGKAMAKSAKLDGKVVAESDKLDGNVVPESDKLDWKMLMDRKVLAKSDELILKVKTIEHAEEVVLPKKGVEEYKEIAGEMVRMKVVKIVADITRADPNQLHPVNLAKELNEKWTKLQHSDCGKEAGKAGLISMLALEMQEMQMRLHYNYFWLEYMLSWQSHQWWQLPLPPLFMDKRATKVDPPLQLAIFPKDRATPWANEYTVPRQLKVVVRVAAPGLKRCPVDLIAVLDTSCGAEEKTQKRLRLLVEAMELIMAKLDHKDRLAIMHVQSPVTEPAFGTSLIAMSEQGQNKISAMLKSIMVIKPPPAMANEKTTQGTSHWREQLNKAMKLLNIASVNTSIRTPETQSTAPVAQSVGGSSSNLWKALEGAKKILVQRPPAEKEQRAGFIIVISDSNDDSIIHETPRRPETDFYDYIVHAVSFRDSGPRNTRAMHHIAHCSNGIYAVLDDDQDEITDAFTACVNKITSIVAVSTVVTIRCNNPDFDVVFNNIQSAGQVLHSMHHDSKSVSISAGTFYAGTVRNIIAIVDKVGWYEYGMFHKFFTADVTWRHPLSRKEDRLDGEVYVRDVSEVFKEVESRLIVANTVTVITDPNLDKNQLVAVDGEAVKKDKQVIERQVMDKLHRLFDECSREAQDAGEALLPNEMEKLKGKLEKERVKMHENQGVGKGIDLTFIEELLAEPLPYMLSWLSRNF